MGLLSSKPQNFSLPCHQGLNCCVSPLHTGKILAWYVLAKQQECMFFLFGSRTIT